MLSSYIPHESSAGPRFRGRYNINILSFDGGGIYGLTEALLLKKLCAGCDWFLSGRDVQVLAGCSAGAINALLLAKYERPREAMQELEDFWNEAGTFSNSDPIGSILSFYGLTPWFSHQDFLRLLEKYFGGLTLKDLKQNVVITAYNWTGEKPTFSQPGLNAPWPFSMFEPSNMTGNTQGGGSWGPLWFHNFPPPKDWKPENDARGHVYLGRDYRVVDIAYAAASPPGFRKIRGGVGDGGAFNTNPALAALGVANGFVDFIWRYTDLEAAIRKTLAEDANARYTDSDLWAEYVNPSGQVRGWSLDKVSIFSIGAGQSQPSYWLRDIDMGPVMFQLMPTNPAAQVWFPPTTYALDPAAAEADIVCSQLLDRPLRFFRLNPPVMNLPTLAAVYASRFPWLLSQLIRQIRVAVESPESKRAVDEALSFLEQQWKTPQSDQQYIAELKLGAERRAAKRKQSLLKRLFAAASKANLEMATRVFNQLADTLGVSETDRLFEQREIFERRDAEEVLLKALQLFNEAGWMADDTEDQGDLSFLLRASVVREAGEAARILIDAARRIGFPVDFEPVCDILTRNFSIDWKLKRVLREQLLTGLEAKVLANPNIELVVLRCLQGDVPGARRAINGDEELRRWLGKHFEDALGT